MIQRLKSGRPHRQQTSRWGAIWAVLRTKRSLVTLAIGLPVALLSIGQVAAQNGIALSPFRALGPSFYAWRAEQQVREANFVRRDGQVAGAQFVAAGQALLASQPFNARAMRTIGWGFAAQGETARARAAMLGSNQITRRDPLTQDWLSRDSAQRNDVAATLRHYDVLLRTQPSVREDMLLRMASVLQLPAARTAIRPLLTADNPWIEGLIGTAATRLPRVAPLAMLIIEHRQMPASPLTQLNYAHMVGRLVTERDFAVLARVYPVLPGASRATMASVALTPDQFDGGYAPLTWDLAAAADWGSARVPVQGSAAQSALEFFAQPSTRGVTASKLLLLDGTAQRMRWQVLDRSQSPGAEAYWQLTCLDRAEGQAVVRSVNLFAGAVVRGATLDLPAGCRVVRVDMIVAGGTGRDPATLVVGDISLSAVATARRTVAERAR